MSDDSHAQSAAIAALAICESLLIALVEKGVLQWDEVYEALECTIDDEAAPFSVMNCNPESRESAVNIIRSLLRRSEIQKVS